MTPTLGRIIHVHAYKNNTLGPEWWAAIVVEASDAVKGVFSARALDPSGAAGDTTRLLIGGDEGQTWRWPPQAPVRTCPNCARPLDVCAPTRQHGVCSVLRHT